MVPVCANYAPGLFVAAWKASQAGAEDQLNDLQTQISSVREILFARGENWLGGTLYGVHTLGFGGGHVVRPIQKLTKAQQREIDTLTEKHSNHEPG